MIEFACEAEGIKEDGPLWPTQSYEESGLQKAEL